MFNMRDFLESDPDCIYFSIFRSISKAEIQITHGEEILFNWVVLVIKRTVKIYSQLDLYRTRNTRLYGREYSPP